MLIIGIDPGISGSICFFQDGKIVDVVEMPTMIEGKRNKKQVNGSQIFNEISEKIKKLDKKEIKVVIEQVSAMPGQGVTSIEDNVAVKELINKLKIDFKDCVKEQGKLLDIYL